MPSKDDVLKQLRVLLSREFELDDSLLTPAARLVEDLDLDSIDAINMAVRLERETGLTLKDEELRAALTVQDIVDVVHRKLHAVDADRA